MYLEVDLPCGRQCVLGHKKSDCQNTGFEPLNAEEEIRKGVESCVERPSLSLLGLP